MHSVVARAWCSVSHQSSTRSFRACSARSAMASLSMPATEPLMNIRIWPTVDEDASNKVLAMSAKQRYNDVVKVVRVLNDQQKSLDNAAHEACLCALNQLGQHAEAKAYLEALLNHHKTALIEDDNSGILDEGLKAYFKLNEGPAALEVLRMCHDAELTFLTSKHYSNVILCHRQAYDAQAVKEYPLIRYPIDKIKGALEAHKLLRARDFYITPSMWLGLLENCLIHKQFKDAAKLINVYTTADMLPPLRKSLIYGLTLPFKYNKFAMVVDSLEKYAEHPELHADADSFSHVCEAVLKPLLRQPKPSQELVNRVLRLMLANGLRLHAYILREFYLPYALQTLSTQEFIVEFSSLEPLVELNTFVMSVAFTQYASKKDIKSYHELLNYAMDNGIEVTWKTIEILMKLHLDKGEFDEVFELAKVSFGDKSKEQVQNVPRPVFRMVLEATIELKRYEDAAKFCEAFIEDNGDEFSQTMRLMAKLVHRVIKDQ
ncbi:hypothetical protein THRCLA_02843 [Thraustotheca clavata]|uniref:Mitochondrial protein n=1 Tax=Thraustotheca clavata TaxID=74557 RepID=A0A1W0A410_9STRA|nr:hypothetical protein THRCLA_02843 [Thraustotheca clavata]